MIALGALDELVHDERIVIGAVTRLAGEAEALDQRIKAMSPLLRVERA